MSRAIPHRLIPLIALCMLPWLAWAEEEPRYFDIELVLFSYPNQYDGGEVWKKAPVESFGFADPQPLSPREPITMPSSEGGEESDWRVLSDQSRQLGPVAYTLRQKAGYPVLLHVKWRQRVRSPQKALPLSLERLTESGRLPSGLEGEVKVYVSRYLHLETDLRLVKNEVYHLQQRRRMRSGELHYLDHPHLGLIALITPYSPPEQEAAPATPVESGTPSP